MQHREICNDGSNKIAKSVELWYSSGLNLGVKPTACVHISLCCQLVQSTYRGAEKSLARPVRKQATAT